MGGGLPGEMMRWGECCVEIWDYLNVRGYCVIILTVVETKDCESENHNYIVSYVPPQTVATSYFIS